MLIKAATDKRLTRLSVLNNIPCCIHYVIAVACLLLLKLSHLLTLLFCFFICFTDDLASDLEAIFFTVYVCIYYHRKFFKYIFIVICDILMRQVQSVIISTWS